MPQVEKQVDYSDLTPSEAHQLLSDTQTRLAHLTHQAPWKTAFSGVAGGVAGVAGTGAAFYVAAVSVARRELKQMTKQSGIPMEVLLRDPAVQNELGNRIIRSFGSGNIRTAMGVAALMPFAGAALGATLASQATLKSTHALRDEIDRLKSEFPPEQTWAEKSVPDESSPARAIG